MSEPRLTDFWTAARKRTTRRNGDIVRRHVDNACSSDDSRHGRVPLIPPSLPAGKPFQTGKDFEAKTSMKKKVDNFCTQGLSSVPEWVLGERIVFIVYWPRAGESKGWVLLCMC